MRDFFIRSLEILINIVVVVAMIGVVIGAGISMANPPPGAPGVLVGLAVLVGGGLYIVLMAGFMYLGLGIYQNTRRTAEILERMAAQK